MNQRLVTKKNRKVRRLRELYPEVKCKILYQRDYMNLLVKYGLEHPSQKDLFESLSSVEETDPQPGSEPQDKETSPSNAKR